LDGDPIDGHQIPITATTARHGKLQRNLIGKTSKGRVHNGVAHDRVGDPNDIVEVGRGGRAPLPTGMGRGGGGATVVVPDHDVDAHPFETKDPGEKKLQSVYMYHGANNSIGRCNKVSITYRRGGGRNRGENGLYEKKKKKQKGHRCHNSISLCAVNMWDNVGQCRTM
jgi:hypothetical protein